MPLASDILLLPSQTITANGTSTGIIIVPSSFTSVILRLNVSGAVSGTSPTLNVFVQQGFRDVGSSDLTSGLALAANSPTVWDDFAAFSQVTSATSRFIRLIGSGGNGATADTAPSDAALTAGTVRTGPLGAFWRVKWTVGGTSPSFGATYLTAQFIA